MSPRPSCASADSRSSRDAGVGSLEKPSRSDEVQTLVVVSSLPQPALVPRAERATHERQGRRSLSFALAPRARSQHDRRRPPRQVPSAGGRRRETRGARLFRDPAHLLAPRHRRVPPVPGVAHRGAHRAVRPVRARRPAPSADARATHRGLSSSGASRFFSPAAPPLFSPLTSLARLPSLHSTRARTTLHDSARSAPSV